MQGKFKLADPGFARFMEKADKHARMNIDGGTITYGKGAQPQVSGDKMSNSAANRRAGMLPTREPRLSCYRRLVIGLCFLHGSHMGRPRLVWHTAI